MGPVPALASRGSGRTGPRLSGSQPRLVQPWEGWSGHPPLMGRASLSCRKEEGTRCEGPVRFCGVLWWEPGVRFADSPALWPKLKARRAGRTVGPALAS